MKIIVVIPARYTSSRFPGKPLIDLLGKTMIERVWERCCLAHPKEDVYVATEDQRIVEHCKLKGIQCVLTTDNCLTGTDRIAEVAQQIKADYYVNVQGDEPVINPEDIKNILALLQPGSSVIYNGFCAIDNEADYHSVSVPKVVFRKDQRLLYMSRAAIPGNKNKQFNQAYRQVCIYAFPPDALQEFAKQTHKTPFEQEEDIEILRFLEMGYEVHMLPMSSESIPIDNPEDVDKVIKRLSDQ